MKFDHARIQEHLLLKISADIITRYQPILRATTANWPYEGNDVSANQESSHCFIAKSIHEIYLHLYDNFLIIWNNNWLHFFFTWAMYVFCRPDSWLRSEIWIKPSQHYCDYWNDIW